MQSSVEMIDMIHKDPCAPYWLKNAVRELCGKDPLDAAGWAEMLAVVMRQRCDEVLRMNRVIP